MSYRSTISGTPLPASYARLLLDLGRDWELDEQAMLSNVRLPTQFSGDPYLRINSHEIARLALNIVKLSGREDLGFVLGQRLKPTSMGFLGYAMMSSENLDESLKLLLKFLKVRMSEVQLTSASDDTHTFIRVNELVDFGPIRRVIMEAMFTSFYSHMCFMTGQQKIDVEICFEWPEPDYYQNYRDTYPTVTWDAEVNQLSLASDFLDTGITMADEAAARQAIGALEQEAVQVGAQPNEIVARTKAELRPGPDGYPKLEEVASRLHTSASTLKRKLKDQGVQFQQLLDEARQKDAIHLMKNTQLTLSEIAELQGFTDPATFTRAFKRWTGKTPSQIRLEFQ